MVQHFFNNVVEPGHVYNLGIFRISGVFTTLSSIYDVTFFNGPWHIYYEVFYSELFVIITHLDS